MKNQRPRSESAAENAPDASAGASAWRDFEQELLEVFPVPCQTLDSGGNILAVNKAWLDVLGYSREEAVGRSFWDFVPEQVVAHYRKTYDQLLADGGRHSLSARVYRADGTVANMDIDCEKITLSVEKLPHLRCILHDDTHHTLLEANLQALSSRYEALLDAIPYILMEVDADKVYTWANPAGYEFFGDDVIGKPASKYFLREQNTYALVAPLFAGASDVIYLESWQRRRDGEERLLAWWCRAIKDVHGQVAGALSTARDITEERKSREALSETSERLQSLVTASPLAVTVLNTDGRVVLWNPAAERMFGWTAREAQAAHLPFVGTEHWEEHRSLTQMVLSGKALSGVEVRRLKKDGSMIDLKLFGAPLRDGGGKVVGAMGILEDITERKQAQEERARLEEQLWQAQRMEAVGRLAGGVAHDFNNLLLAISGYAELTMSQLNENDPARENVQRILEAADRAGALTGHLLALSRKQVLSMTVMNLNTVVTEVEAMLKHIIGEDIDVRTVLEKPLACIEADYAQVEQILINLTVNSRDAMPDGGYLLIETANVMLDEEQARTLAGVTPGRYVMMAVSDTGVGMDEETVQRAFEPFFTTKETGRGTGLGLSTVYGIVEQHGGRITLSSRPGEGACVKMYFPVVSGRLETDARAIAEPAGDGGSETVLVVEDESVVRNLVSTILVERGYRVISFSSPHEALEAVKRRTGDIDLLITDVVMPGMNGRELHRQLAEVCGDTKVLYMSGYSDGVLGGLDAEGTSAGFLQKPFSVSILAEKVRDVLES